MGLGMDGKTLALLVGLAALAAVGCAKKPYHVGRCDRPALMGCLSVAIAPLVSVKGLAFLPTLLDQLGLPMSEISAPLAAIVFPVPSY